MPKRTENLLEQLNRNSADRHHLRQIVFALSFAVILMVFWSLKLTGIGIAGEAFCGKAEHVHSEECASPCPQEEHIHIESCYSNIYADLETVADWKKAFADMALGPTSNANLVLVAQSQMGYQESTLNFQVDEYGIRRGITRYGQWYGNPYGDWSAMFACFCLNYAGAQNVPMNAGPEAMRLAWEKANLYAAAGNATPEIGNLLFLCKGEVGTQGCNAIGIITAYDANSITVIEGDVNGTVALQTYSRGSPLILGYGLVPESDVVVVLSSPSGNATNYTLWLDGTNGGLGHLTGSPNTAHTLKRGSVVKLPSTWTSPSKYSYKLRGWYDVTNSKYYPPGGELEITGNTVLYADWVAATYDLGVFNAQVTETVSTNSFITTHMFDYNYLFNVHSSRAEVSFNNGSHSEVWSMVTSGNVPFRGQGTANFIFTDNDSGGMLNMPNNRSNQNMYHDATTVTPCST